MTAEEFVNKKLGDKNYTHSKYSMFRKEIEEWLNEFAEHQVKLLATPAVSKCDGLQNRELLLAYTQWLSERDNVDTYWLDDSDVDNFLSKQ